MDLKERIAAKIAGEPPEHLRRSALLEEIVTAFDRGGVDVVKARLVDKVSGWEKEFSENLALLRKVL